MEHLSLEELLMTLLTDPNGPQSIAFNRHPGGFKVKVAAPDGELKSAGHEDADEFTDVAYEFLASLLPIDDAPVDVTPSAETSPLPTLPSEAPAAPLPPPHSDADLDFLQEEASDPEAATPEPPAH